MATLCVVAQILLHTEAGFDGHIVGLGGLSCNLRILEMDVQRHITQNSVFRNSDTYTYCQRSYLPIHVLHTDGYMPQDNVCTFASEDFCS
jgi:hypothetical protein